MSYQIVIGVDAYNQTATGAVAITLRAAAGGTDTTPCVMIAVENKDVEVLEQRGNIADIDSE